MYSSIGIEIIAPNAFIRLNENRQNSVYSLPLFLIVDYGNEVVKELYKTYDKNNIVYLLVSKAQIELFKKKYGNYFSFTESDNFDTIVNLKMDINEFKNCFNQNNIYYDLELENIFINTTEYLNNLYLQYVTGNYTRKRQL